MPHTHTLRTQAKYFHTVWLMQARTGSKITLGQNAPLHISYNAGLQALQLGKYATALRCFQVSLNWRADAMVVSYNAASMQML